MQTGSPKVLAEFPLGNILRHIPRVGQPFSKELTHSFKVGKKKYAANITSDTLRLVAQNPVCISCGIRASFVKLLQHQGEYFIELYINKDNQEFKLTKDHIIPKARGGVDSFRNYQVMCADCNQKKGAHHDYFVSEYWYLHWDGVGWAEGPYKLPFKTASQEKVRTYVRERLNYKKLPKRFECFPSHGYHLVL